MTNNEFDPRQHLMQIKKGKNGESSDYLPVQWRLVWFREQCPDGQITTEIVHLDLDKEMEEEASVWNADKKRSEKVIKTGRGVAIVRATVKDGKGGVATGTKMEKAVSFGDFLEKAETGAIGRALAALGFGTQFAPELFEEDRIVDSPVTHHSANLNGNVSSSNSSPKSARNGAQGQREAFQQEVNGKNGQALDKARFTALYHAGKSASLIDGEGWMALFDWASKELKREVNRAGDLSEEEITNLETIVKQAEATHA